MWQKLKQKPSPVSGHNILQKWSAFGDILILDHVVLGVCVEQGWPIANPGFSRIIYRDTDVIFFLDSNRVPSSMEAQGSTTRPFISILTFICFRRGKLESGDVDVLLTHPSYTSKKNDKKLASSLLKSVVESLKNVFLITDTISLGDVKFMVSMLLVLLK